MGKQLKPPTPHDTTARLTVTEFLTLGLAPSVSRLPPASFGAEFKTDGLAAPDRGLATSFCPRLSSVVPLPALACSTGPQRVCT